MLAGRVSAVLSQKIQQIAAQVEASELADMLVDVPDRPRKTIDD
jgi:hypothetical protein